MSQFKELLQADFEGNYSAIIDHINLSNLK